jgi:hypothetical protein
MNATPRLSGLQKRRCLPRPARFSGRQAFCRLPFLLPKEQPASAALAGVTAKPVRSLLLEGAGVTPEHSVIVRSSTEVSPGPRLRSSCPSGNRPSVAWRRWGLWSRDNRRSDFDEDAGELQAAPRPRRACYRSRGVPARREKAEPSVPGSGGPVWSLSWYSGLLMTGPRRDGEVRRRLGLRLVGTGGGCRYAGAGRSRRLRIA